MRRIVVFFSAALVFLCAAYTTVGAEVDRSLLDETRALLAFNAPASGTEPRVVIVNGAHVRIATGQSELSLVELLDHFARSCREQSGGLSRSVRRILDPRAHDRELPSLSDGVLRVESEREGLVACLALGTGEFDAGAFLERLRRFVRHGDLQELGGVRVIRVRRHARGTFFVAAYNEGPLPLWRMFPRAGDAPGVDLAGVSRPRHARRLLSAFQIGAPSALAVYGSLHTVRDALDAYAAQLAQEGYDVVRVEPRTAEAALLVMRAGHARIVRATPNHKGSLLTVLALDDGGSLSLPR